MSKHTIYEQILNVAEDFTQTSGYNAFSYRDIAKRVGIKTSSIHYYFPTKADLGKAVVKKHIDTLCDELGPLLNNKKLSCRKKLALFFEGVLAKTYFADKKMCLGGMLASDVITLPAIIQTEVRIFFNRIEAWLKELLLEGLARKEFHLEKKDIQNEIVIILSLLEGALLLARLYQNENYLIIIEKHVMARLMRD